MGIIIYNGRSSKDYRIQVEHPPGYDTPERDYEKIHVPGRNGDVIIDKGSYQNVKRTYEIAVGDLDEYFPILARGISEWLHSSSGYARLEDSYEPDHYRMASYDENTEIENILFHLGRVKISFDCKPQRYLKIGDKKIKCVGTKKIKNPTPFASTPIISVYGSGAGTVVINDYSIGISDIRTCVVINSELQDAYFGQENRNSTITLSKGFPTLKPGVNAIGYTGGVTYLEVTPKWWTL